ncbi:MAG: exosome complex RNA-binding protein Csl4 [Thermoplasmatales archaeon]|nr:exosome complex RNA-binding protein Csl4 [Thermoplasmatales archaeon]
MIAEGSIVIPGEKIATTEELLVGNGTYEEGGVIKASIVGKFIIEREKMKATVKPLTDLPLVLKEGDIVICEIKQIGENIVIAKILHLAGKKREIAGEKEGAIFISNIDTEFVDDIKSKFRVGDIIRARITRVDPVINFSTKDSHLGVIKAFCTNCRNILIRKNNILECKVCGRIEIRKIADDYGSGNIDRVI